MKMNKGVLRDLNLALLGAGLKLDDLETRSSEVVLFGSRSTHTENEGSDWDILCVGNGERFKDSMIDIVWIRPDKLFSPEWLGSELAGHVSKYGQWLKGEGKWRTRVFVSENTKRHKEQKIEARISGLTRSWGYLGDEYRWHKSRLLRQDAQRLIIMKSGDGVPPRRILDSDWKNHLETQKKVLAILFDLAKGLENKRFVEENVFEYM